MCIFGSSKQPSVSPAPTPAPAPIVTPSEISPQASDEARRKRLERVRNGLASTMKTGPRGIVGAGAELGSMYNTQKSKLGA